MKKTDDLMRAFSVRLFSSGPKKSVGGGLGGIFNVAGKDGQPLTEKQQILKEDLERSYFRDMKELTADPNGKLFEAKVCVGEDRQRLMLLDYTFTAASGEAKTFSADELRRNGQTVFLVYQLGLYASPFTNEWKQRLLKQWPHLQGKIYALELREKNFAYSILRWATQGTVKNNWVANLTDGESEADRLAHLLHWQEDNKTKLDFRKMRKLVSNKYVPFVFVVDGAKGELSFKAVGRPKPSEFKQLASVFHKST